MFVISPADEVVYLSYDRLLYVPPKYPQGQHSSPESSQKIDNFVRWLIKENDYATNPAGEALVARLDKAGSSSIEVSANKTDNQPVSSRSKFLKFFKRKSANPNKNQTQQNHKPAEVKTIERKCSQHEISVLLNDKKFLEPRRGIEEEFDLRNLVNHRSYQEFDRKSNTRDWKESRHSRQNSSKDSNENSKSFRVNSYRGKNSSKNNYQGDTTGNFQADSKLISQGNGKGDYQANSKANSRTNSKPNSRVNSKENSQENICKDISRNNSKTNFRETLDIVRASSTKSFAENFAESNPKENQFLQNSRSTPNSPTKKNFNLVNDISASTNLDSFLPNSNVINYQAFTQTLQNTNNHLNNNNIAEGASNFFQNRSSSYKQPPSYKQSISYEQSLSNPTKDNFQSSSSLCEKNLCATSSTSFRKPSKNSNKIPPKQSKTLPGTLRPSKEAEEKTFNSLNVTNRDSAKSSPTASITFLVPEERRPTLDLENLEDFLGRKLSTSPHNNPRGVSPSSFDVLCGRNAPKRRQSVKIPSDNQVFRRLSSVTRPKSANTDKRIDFADFIGLNRSKSVYNRKERRGSKLFGNDHDFDKFFDNDQQGSMIGESALYNPSGRNGSADLLKVEGD